MNKELLEQLNQIYKNQPVFSGDLISKNAKNELLDLKLIMYYQDSDFKFGKYNYNVGGYVLTELGKEFFKNK